MAEGHVPPCSHPLPGNGRYRVLALSSDPGCTAADVLGYAVVTLAGDRVRVEPTLALALAWIGQRMAQEQCLPSARRTPLRH